MADQTWDRIKELFHAALKYPVEERAQFLAAACGDDDALRSEVADLLSAHYDLGDDSISIDHGSPVKQKGAVFPVEGPGSVIGRYRPLEEIGEGGMGVVYLAQQEQPVRRKVALKIIKLGMDTREVIARFEAERQALAIMDHGNIARVFDAGTTEMGRPYFVMEYIPGIPVTDYCDQERLSAEQRLGLFIEICHAIHHAHQKGIIHRDIKPSNVLVTVQDGKPVPKIIDFGVAKAVNRELSEKTFFTEHGMLIGTPVYMSPEQADSAGGDVDTTADVYSLGVLLYELLAGAPPFDPQSMREVGFEAIRRLIREVDPPTPSTRLSGMGSEAMVIAGNRRTRPSTLEKKIRGELDWITMRAMEKNRDRRYQSASEFAADIERYLNGEPVQAGPPGRLYRARKFVHRNKTAVGLVTTVAIFLVTVAITMTIQANRIARERDRTRLEAERARSEAEMLQGLILNDMDRMTPGTPAEVARRVRESWDLHRSSPVISDRELALWSTNMIIHLDFSIAFGRGERTAAVGLREELCSQVLRTIDEAVAEKDTSIVKTIDVLIGHYEEGVLSDGLIDLEAQTSRLYRVGLELRRQMHPSLDPELRNYLDKFASYLLRTGRRALEEERIPEAAAIFRELHTIRQETHPFPSYQGGLAKGLLGESLT
ncbi:MAG: serine/threonine-protein kinase, partial [Candidatus Latescibacterota bacterium]